MAAVENTGETLVPQAHGGALRRLPPGRSFNPGGRPKGLMRYVRQQTRDVKELADFMLAILRRTGEFEHGRLSLDVRMQAATWLAERGFGRVPQQTELTGRDGAPLALAVVPFDYAATVAELSPLEEETA